MIQYLTPAQISMATDAMTAMAAVIWLVSFVIGTLISLAVYRLFSR